VTIAAGLIVSRFVHYAAVLLLFGLSLYPLYADAGETQPRLRGWMLWAVVVALLGSVPWLIFTAANMADDMGSGFDWDTLEPVLFDTAFGSAWLARDALALVLAGLLMLPRGGRMLPMLLAAALLASLAAVGHTQQTEGGAHIVHVGADALHLLAAGAWLGGLVALAYTLFHSGGEEEQILMRFSGMGYIAVAVLIVSGLINGLFLVGTLDALIGTTYGQLLLVKLGLFGGMLALALSNRFWLVPALKAGEPRTLARLRRHVIGEEALGLLVILVVSVLGTIEPAATQLGG
jgi:putative copper resistance protein D